MCVRWRSVRGEYSAQRGGRSGRSPIVRSERLPSTIGPQRGKGGYMYDEMLLTADADKAMPVDRVNLSDLDQRVPAMRYEFPRSSLRGRSRASVAVGAQRGRAGGPDTGACRCARASKKHGAAPGRTRRLHLGLPPRRVGVRIKQRSARSGPGSPGDPGYRGHRQVRLRERVGIRAVAGVRPGRPADTGRSRCLVRPARRRARRPCPGLEGSRPPWPRRDSPIWPGHAPRRPGTRPDMAGRQRQLVFLTHAVSQHNRPDAVRFSTRSALGQRHES